MCENKPNQVTLDLEEYLKLYNFKKEIEGGSTLVISEQIHYRNGYAYTNPPKYITTDLAVEEIAKVNVKLAEDLENVTKDLRQKTLDLNDVKEKTKKEIKNKSLWQLILWKYKK